MKYSTEQLINFWAIASMFSLILSAVSLFFFRYYSGIKSEQKFTEIGTQIQTEVNKAIDEIDQTKTTLQLKLNNEVDSILKELRTNATSANSSLEKLKEETSSLIQGVKQDLGELKEETKKTLEEIKNPIGTEFKLVEFKFKIPNTEFKDFGKSLIESGELKKSIELLKRAKLNSSIGVLKERIPKEIEKIGENFNWIRLRVIENLTNDINSSNELFSLKFGKPNQYETSLSAVLSNENVIKDYIFHIKSKTIESTEVRKSEGINSINQICNKFVVIESAFKDSKPQVKPFDLTIGYLYITDSNLNVYQFFPIKKHEMGLYPETLKHLGLENINVTVGFLKCK